MRVAAKLGIPFHTFDFSEQYKQSVVDYMLREYAAGKTPNPDVMCNKSIKFGAFLLKAREMGAEHIATGHYARLRPEIRNPKSDIRNKSQIRNPNFQNTTVDLLQAKDKNKDQTYFLWTLTQEQLRHCLFPIGDYTKTEVREMARERGLITADKRESQGLCFLGKIDVRAFLGEHIGVVPGVVIDTSGRVIGEHEGAALYTLGQRHGFRITAPHGASSAPLYVVARDVDANTITVAPRELASIEPFARRCIALDSCNWISSALEFGREYLGRMRHRGELMSCRLEQLSSETRRARVVFDTPLLAAPGQSLVLYEREMVVGGGIVGQSSV